MEKLPGEIATNILSRLPFKSIGQSRCVSKLWCTILSDSTISKNTPDILLLYKESCNPKIYYVEDKEQTFSQEPIKPFKTFDSRFLANSFYDYPYIVGSCNGLICSSQINFLNISLFPWNPIYIFNPVTGEHSALPRFSLPERGFPDEIKEGKKTDKCLSGFGFDDSTKKFKLVLVIFSARNYGAQIFNNEVQVHTLGSTDWRQNVGIVPDVLHRAIGKVSVAFVSGCLHWITIDQSSPTDGPLIVSFNLGVEEFEFVPTPESNQLKHHYNHYQLGVLGEYLAVVENCAKGYTQIWVMKNYGVKASWVKQFSIEHDSVSRHGFCSDYVDLVKMSKNGELLLLCDNKYLVYYNNTSQSSRFIEIEGVPKRGKYYLLANPLVGNPISLKSACGVDYDTEKT